MDAARQERLSRKFQAFATHGAGEYAPTWARVAALAARTPALLALVEHARPGQQQPNLLLTALHVILLRDPTAAPAARLAAMGDDEIVELMLGHAAEITGLVATRLVQTNEVRRASYLRAALAHVQAESERPLALVEVGTSAGLLLRVDRYRYRYGDLAEVGPSDAPVLIDCELRGERTPPLGTFELAARVGIDLAPVRTDDAAAVAWLRALVWPDHPERLRMLDAALADAAMDPPELVAGDARAALPEVLAGLPQDVTPVVFHSFVLVHWPEAERAEFGAFVEDLRRSRPALRYLRTELTDPPLRLDDAAIAEHHQHGAWLQWL